MSAFTCPEAIVEMTVKLLHRQLAQWVPGVNPSLRDPSNSSLAPSRAKSAELFAELPGCPQKRTLK